MRTLYIFILFTIIVFTFVGGAVTLLSTWLGNYEPYVNGPDPLTLFLVSLIAWLYADRALKNV